MLNTSIDSFHFYFLVAVLQGFVLSGLIIFRRPIRGTNIYIGLLVFVSSLSLLHGVLEESIHHFNARFLFPLEYGLLLGPLIFFHTRQVIDPAFRLKRRHLFHFILSVLLDVVLYLGVFGYARINSQWALEHVQQIQMCFLIVALFFILHITTYILIAYHSFQTATIKPRAYAAPLKKWVNLHLALWTATPVLMTLVVSWAILNINIFDDNSFMVYNPLGIIKACFIYALGYIYLLKYVPVLNNYFIEYGRDLTVRLSPELILQKRRQLENLLEQSEIYMDEELTVRKLANNLDWHENELSRIIGEVFGSNFNDLINSYRVKAFKKLAVNPDNKKYSIMGLARQAGFASKTSFYRAFKKETGLTPTEFLSAEKT